MNRLLVQLQGGDLRSTGPVERVLAGIKTQADFDLLAEGLFVPDRLVVMRAADALEKITRSQPAFLHKHHAAILGLLPLATNKELQWHLALLAPRLKLDETEQKSVWTQLAAWLTDARGSRIVRVNALQGLYQLAQAYPVFQADFQRLAAVVRAENIPALQARLRRLAKTGAAWLNLTQLL